MAGQSGVRRFKFGVDGVLLTVAVVGILIGGGGLYYNERLGSQHTGWVEMARTLQSSALEVGRVGSDVGRGIPADFTELVGQTENLEEFVRVLREGDDIAGVPPMPSSVKNEVNAVDQAWATIKQALDRMLAAEDAVSQAQDALRSIDDAGAKLYTLYAGIAPKLAEGGAGAERVVIAGTQMGRAERIRVLARRLLGDGRDADKITAELVEEIKALIAAHNQLEGDGPVGTRLREERQPVDVLAGIGEQLAAAGPTLGEMQLAAAVLPGDSKNLLSAAKLLEGELGPLSGAGQFKHSLILPALGVAIAALLLFVFTSIISVRGRIRRAEENDRKQQAAILSLLDEMGTLADGDLTVHANVTADFTGAIADSVNSTVDTLRGLVGTINETAVELGAAATSTQETATQMQAASETQASDVVQIAGQMKKSSDSLSAVAARAEQLSQQAGNSVNVAHNGASTVGRTIQGMAALREQIQDTAKRIKRLGESSQEIGNIIEFINDIAEQTNTLALNASIQAAMAGESGRGFAMVADEVQRLAERAAAATRQIETLVKTIQADTNEAIVSMERSTANVISGARSAEEAGQALTRIEATSTDLARMIQDISGEARSEAAQAARIAGQVESIRDTAIQTASSAQTTAAAVGELNTLSEKLRQSVAGFKLPADVSLEPGMLPAFTDPQSGR